MSTRWLATVTATLLLVWFVVPVVPVLLWAFADEWSFPAVLPQEWGVRGWAQAGASGAAAALGRSLVLGAVVAFLAVLLGLGAARTLAWPPRPAGSVGTLVLGYALLAPVALPPFALAMGLDVLLLRLRIPAPVALVVLLTVFALPYTTYTLRAGFLALDPQIEDQARMLGARHRAAFLRVTLPALAPAVGAAAFLGFLIGWSDYVVTVVISGGRFTTLPVLIGSAASRTGNEAQLGALSLISVAVPMASAVLAGLMARRLVDRPRRKGPTHAR